LTVEKDVDVSAEMALLLPPNWCLIFFRDPEGKFTSARMTEALREAGFTVTGRKEPFVVRRRDGPTFYVSILRGSHIETIIRSLVGRRRKYRTLIPGCDTQIKIEFHDLEEVLDEINTLNEIQWTLGEATRGLIYRSWNQVFSGPDD
jgi:hypothetical protein